MYKKYQVGVFAYFNDIDKARHFQECTKGGVINSTSEDYIVSTEIDVYALNEATAEVKALKWVADSRAYKTKVVGVYNFD